MAEWVFAVERAYVAAATRNAAPPLVLDEPAAIAAKLRPGRARAAAGAVASRYLAVGTPRSFSLVVDTTASISDAVQSLVAHRTWFAPRDIRCAGSGAEELVRELASTGSATDARVTSLEEALTCDIVCMHATAVLAPGSVRRGTHFNVLAPAVLVSDEVATMARITTGEAGLDQLAAGFVDGRQLDEITIFVLGEPIVALAALGG